MKILGIDPGTGRIGFGLLESHSPVRVLDYGVITPAKAERWDRLAIIYAEIQRLLSTHVPDLVVLERLFFSKNVKTAMAVSEAIGVILLAARHCGVPIKEYTPLEVKEVLVGSGKAKKREVKGMLEILLGCKLKGPDDAADAVAIAYCHLSLEALGLCSPA